MTSDKTVERLSLYRHILARERDAAVKYLHSHQLASLANATAAQVRHDLMAIGYSGNPNQGYAVEELIASIGEFLDTPLGRNIALVGVGNLGRAILSDFAVRRPRLRIVAAFDVEPDRVDRVIHGCRCYRIDRFREIVRDKEIGVGVLAVPAGEAQGVADRMVEAGVYGILNFAPVRLRVQPHVYVANVNITVALESVSYFAGKKAAERKSQI
jgi:redox-sensing transcriptional repressor